jgi:hypothetical protein
MIENRSADKNPFTAKSGTIFAPRRINSALITNENNPNVRIVIGSVSNVTIGLINSEIIPRITAKTTAPVNVASTPGNMYTPISIAITLIINCKIFIVLVKFHQSRNV